MDPVVMISRNGPGFLHKAVIFPALCFFEPALDSEAADLIGFQVVTLFNGLFSEGWRRGSIRQKSINGSICSILSDLNWNFWRPGGDKLYIGVRNKN